MTSFFDYLMPQNTGFDNSQSNNIRSQGFLNAAAALANLSAPGFNKATPTPLQLVTSGLQGYQQGTQSGLDQFYTNEVNKSKAKQAGLDSTYADKMQPLMQGFDTSGFSTPPIIPQTASRAPQLTDFYQPLIANPSTQRPVNNPGNLRPVGASTGFRQFPTPEAGMAALTQDLTAKLTGKSAAMGGRLPTLRNIISVYSPSNENATPQLIQNAAMRSGLNPDQPLTIADLPKLQQAILTQEQGGTGAVTSATSIDPVAAGVVQQPSGVPGDAYLGNQIRTIGMLQSMAGKPSGDNLLKMGLQADPRFSFMRTDNTPAAVQIANSIMAARNSGNKEYETLLTDLSKAYEKSMVPDGKGGVVERPGYTNVVSKVEGAKAGGKTQGETDAAAAIANNNAIGPIEELKKFNENSFEMPYMDKISKIARFSPDEEVRKKAEQTDLMRQARLDLAAPLAKQLGVNPTDKDFQASLDRIFDINSSKESRANQILALEHRIQARMARNPYNSTAPAAPADSSGWSVKRVN